MADALLKEVLSDLGRGNAGLTPYIEGLRRWNVWRKNVPLFYSTCVHAEYDTTSGTVQLLPYLHADARAPGLLRHGLIRGEVDPGGGKVLLNSVAVDQPPENNGRGTLLSSSGQKASPIIECVAEYQHPLGSVDLLRYCPAKPTLLVAKCTGAGLSLFDISGAVERLARVGQEAAMDVVSSEEEEKEGEKREGEGADAVEGNAGGCKAAGDEAAMGEREEEGGEEAEREEDAANRAGDDGIRGGPVHEMRSTEQEGVALAWGSSGAGGGGSGSGGLRLFSAVSGGGIAEYGLREDGSLAEVAVRRAGGHDPKSEVKDLAWGGSWEAAAGPSLSPSAAVAMGAVADLGLLASVGSDGRTLLWDARQVRPALRAPRCRDHVNGVAFAPPGGGGGGGKVADDAGAGPLIANGGEDGIIRVYDIRQLSSSGGDGTAAAAGGASTSAGGGGGGTGGSPASPALYRLKGHRCPILQLAFSPHNRRLLASSDAQGRVLLWEPGRTEPLPEGLATRPELLFTHAGHLLPVDDFSWSTELYGTLASVSGFLDVNVVTAAQQAAEENEPGTGVGLDGQRPAVVVWRPAADMLPPAPSQPSATGQGAGVELAAAAPREQEQQLHGMGRNSRGRRMQ